MRQQQDCLSAIFAYTITVKLKTFILRMCKTDCQGAKAYFETYQTSMMQHATKIVSFF